MSTYFDNFSIAQYNGQLCRNITNRVAITQDFIKRTAGFYPYLVPEGERADTLSFLYYNAPSLDWLVYFANDVVDPYYDWHMTEQQFNDYMVSKYGSLIETQLKVHHFQIEWANDQRFLTQSAYDALPAVSPNNVKQYWRPTLDDVGMIVGYGRKPDDRVATTNRIVELTFDDTTGFVVGELISQQSGGVVTGYAEITLVEDTRILVKHVTGVFNILSDVIGFTTQTTYVPTTVSTISEVIPSAEQTYWRPVSIYEYEELLNNQRRSIKLVNKAFSETAESNLNTLMK